MAFGFETRSFWLWSMTLFSSVHCPHQSNFIYQTTPHFSLDELFLFFSFLYNLLYYVSYKVEAQSML